MPIYVCESSPRVECNKIVGKIGSLDALFFEKFQNRERLLAGHFLPARQSIRDHLPLHAGNAGISARLPRSLSLERFLKTWRAADKAR